MGGKGSGGRRVGAGRKPKTRQAAALTGWAGHRDRGRKRRKTADPALVAMPVDLPDELRDPWALLAPYAMAAQTLTPASVGAFVDLVLGPRDITRWVLAQLKVEGLLVDGGPSGSKAHPLLGQYRALLPALRAAYAQFNLAPIGKPMPGAEGEAPVDPFAEFDEAVDAPAAAAQGGDIQ